MAHALVQLMRGSAACSCGANHMEDDQTIPPIRMQDRLLDWYIKHKSAHGEKVFNNAD